MNESLKKQYRVHTNNAPHHREFLDLSVEFDKDDSRLSVSIQKEFAGVRSLTKPPLKRG